MPSDWPCRLGAPSKKNATGTCRICEICCRRLAPTRLVPFSYFCTCWKVRPSASPSFSWLMPSMIRRMRTRLPTYLSTGLGALVDISSTPWDYARRWAKRKRSMPQALVPSKPASLGDAPANDENQAGGDDHRCGDVAAARVNGRRNCSRQARIQYAFDAEAEPCDDPSHRIDHGGDARVRRTDHRQSLLDRAQPRLLQVLVRAG